MFIWSLTFDCDTNITFYNITSITYYTKYQFLLFEQLFSHLYPRYFYLIIFAMYIREIGPKEFPMTFKQWMEAKGDLVNMIAEGRGKLEWERKIPDEKLVELKELLDSNDFKANLSRVSTELPGLHLLSRIMIFNW